MHPKPSPKKVSPPSPPLHLHNIDDHQSGSDTVNNEKWGFCRQMGWDMKADWSAGSGFLSVRLLINGADEGHNSSPAQDCHSARPLSDHSCPHAAGLLLTLFCLFFSFCNLKESASIRLLRNLIQDFFFFFFFLPHTHTFGERKRHRQSEAADLSKIKPFFFFLTPYQFGKSVRSKWFPKPQVIRLCLPPWLRLQDWKIKRACSSSEMSSNRLNSSAVIKYSSVDVSARVPAKNDPL